MTAPRDVDQKAAKRQVILLDFVKGESRCITQEEAAQRMVAQSARGVRMTSEGVMPPPPEKRWLRERALFWFARSCESAALKMTKRRRYGR